MGHSSGEIVAAYCAGMLSLESAMTVAYHRGKLSSQLDKKNVPSKGAMLAVGLPALEAQKFIGDIKEGKATVACINSPKSVTISGDKDAVEELHLKLEGKGIFSRKLKVGVAYHSEHMMAIASDYSRALRNLDVLPRNPKVKFCSSVYPGISVETDSEYWVRNMLSPVRFSDAMKAVLANQTDRESRIDACIEIGPHSALAGPFKQICQELPADNRPAYISSILRGEDSVENMLATACEMFKNGWNIDIACLNFPYGDHGHQVLTNLPPYSWNHDTQHWHEGRLARNYRHRQQPPHDLLGTFLDDSSDLDMRWTKYIRCSELPWLKEHVIRSEVLLPGAAYLAMAMIAATQKSSMSGLEVKGYTLRDITFSKPLVIPDSADGAEVSLILEPFQHSSSTASKSWSEFRVLSFGEDRTAYEHCHGLISTSYQPGFNFSSSDEAALASVCHSESMQAEPYKNWTSRAAAMGNDLGPSFRLITKSVLEDDKAFCSLSAPDGENTLPLSNDMSQKISVPLFDAILQVSLLAIGGSKRSFEGTVFPTSIREMIVSTQLGHLTGQEMQAHGCTAKLGARDYEGRAIITKERGRDTFEPIAQVQGAMFVCISREDDQARCEDNSTKLCWNVKWQLDVDDLTQDFVQENWPIHEYTQSEVSDYVSSEKAAWFSLRAAFESLVDADVQRMAPHHRHYYEWMKTRYDRGKTGRLAFQTSDWSIDDPKAVENALRQASSVDTAGRMVVRVGRRLLDILRGEVDPLSVMLEDDLLNEYYADNWIQDHVYEHAAHFAALVAHKNPKQKILEIGAGTG